MPPVLVVKCRPLRRRRSVSCWALTQLTATFQQPTIRVEESDRSSSALTSNPLFHLAKGRRAVVGLFSLSLFSTSGVVVEWSECPLLCCHSHLRFSPVIEPGQTYSQLDCFKGCESPAPPAKGGPDLGVTGWKLDFLPNFFGVPPKEAGPPQRRSRLNRIEIVTPLLTLLAHAA